MIRIEKFGLYEDIPEEVYHADTLPVFGPTLSASGAKVLLRSPAAFAYERANPKPSSKSMDLGSIAHLIVLGKGSSVTRVDAANWTTKAAREAKEAIIAAGSIPANNTEYGKAEAMAESVLSHPVAGPLFSGGQAEVSAYWRDRASGVACRGRFDYLTDENIVDLKTTASADPESFAKSCANYGYRESAAQYCEGVLELTGMPRSFLIVAVESAAPYFVAVYTFSLADMEAGANRMARARRLYAQYEAEGYPTIETRIRELEMPAWADGGADTGTFELETASPESRF